MPQGKDTAAAAEFGRILCAHLKALDMTDADELAAVIRQIIVHDDELLRLADCARRMGAGKLAASIRSRATPPVRSRARRPQGRVPMCIPGKLEDGSDSYWFDPVTGERVPEPKMRRGSR